MWVYLGQILHLLLDLVLFLFFWVCLLINLRVNTYIL
jgi:hypothetical protein